VTLFSFLRRTLIRGSDARRGLEPFPLVGERAALVLTLDAEAATLAQRLLREAGFGAELQG
jgi:hypothetical protein